MTGFVAKLLDQPYWVIALLLGAALVVLPCVTINKDYYWKSHPPNAILPVVVGLALIALSSAAFVFSHLQDGITSAGAGVDLTRVKEHGEALSTVVGDCEINVVKGRIDDQAQLPSAAIVVLPCNEYFDDECAHDSRSALGAYVARAFEGQADAFISLAKEECARRFGKGTEQQKTCEVRGQSFGVGQCAFLVKPLGRATPVALVSTTTQRAGQGLASQISYLFSAMHALVARLADTRFDEVVMPVLGAGHGGIYPPLAFVGLLLAVAEAARYRQGGWHLKRVTIVVYRRDAQSSAQVDDAVIRRALALVGS